jgi:hypothetical protein
MNESAPSAAPKMPLWAKALIAVGILALILCGLWWWMNRPIQPVLLSAQEKALVETKIQAIQKPAEAIQKPDEPKYEKGSREIILTERELNGLLNDKTTLGKTVCFELATNAIHARVETDLDPGIPIVGGRRLKAKARFLVSDVPGEASFILDDVTVWGISMPNEWLAGLKGKNLLGEMIGAGQTGKVPGVEEFKVEAGRLIIRLKE